MKRILRFVLTAGWAAGAAVASASVPADPYLLMLTPAPRRGPVPAVRSSQGTIAVFDYWFTSGREEDLVRCLSSASREAPEPGKEESPRIARLVSPGTMTLFTVALLGLAVTRRKNFKEEQEK